MNFLFVHQNFPGQFKNLAPELAKNTDNRVIAICSKQQAAISNIEYYSYHIKNSYNTHPLLIEEYSKIIRAEGVLRVAKKLLKDGFKPDVIYVHPGWGEGLFLREIWPNAYIIGYFEYFYRDKRQDFGFDPEYPTSEHQKYLLRLKNNSNYQSLEYCDSGISPTKWQRSTYPKWAQKQISIIHDGIDTKICQPNANQKILLEKDNLCLSKSEQVVTFVARNLEPLRGFCQFMRALPFLLEKYPKAHFLIVGRDDVGYGAKLLPGNSYKKKMLEEVGEQLEPKRVHFLGHLSYDDYLKVLQVSSVHYYATYPFVISWSLLEAMSCGCAIAAANVDPVNEFIQNKANGLVFDFFDINSIVLVISQLLDDKMLRKKLGKQARKTIKSEYSLQDCIKRHKKFIKSKIN